MHKEGGLKIRGRSQDSKWVSNGMSSPLRLVCQLLWPLAGDSVKDRFEELERRVAGSAASGTACSVCLRTLSVCHCQQGSREPVPPAKGSPRGPVRGPCPDRSVANQRRGVGSSWYGHCHVIAEYEGWKGPGLVTLSRRREVPRDVLQSAHLCRRRG